MKIVEIFHSLQGEGNNIGKPTVFIRTAGCNLRCGWCDTRYAWDGGEKMSVQEILERVKRFDTQQVCITGGEPLLQDELNELIDGLLKMDKKVDIQTNGSLDISDLVKKDVSVSMDYKTPSSGMKDKMLKENIKRLRKRDELKFVIADQKDFKYAVDLLRGHEYLSNIIFQPEGGEDLKELAEWVLEEDIDVRVLPQLHKIIWGDERGV
ncbi:MAG: 7-carboxy-7-deazaguanine synthase QueE [Candidatus Natronoplasma sp.]